MVLGIRVNTESCVKQIIVVKYGTVSSDTFSLNVSQARTIMQHVVDYGKKELDKKCKSKATLKLGTVQVSESSGYEIEASVEYLIHIRYKRWDFATCAANANVFENVVNDPTLAPPIKGQYSTYVATGFTQDSSGLSVSSTCCKPGSVVVRERCRMF